MSGLYADFMKLAESYSQKGISRYKEVEEIEPAFRESNEEQENSVCD